ncbi:MAG TPA: hypothetical protein VF144_20940 [Chitinophagaceae bacterium]
MKKKLVQMLVVGTLLLVTVACHKQMEQSSEYFKDDYTTSIKQENQNPSEHGVERSYIPLSLTIFNPCCEEQIFLKGIIHRVQNSNVIHMDSRDISGLGLSSGLEYTVQSVSVRNYVFDTNENLATLNWSVRMESENGCGYNVQFVVHVTRDDDGDIKASIHNGNFFCH